MFSKLSFLLVWKGNIWTVPNLLFCYDLCVGDLLFVYKYASQVFTNKTSYFEYWANAAITGEKTPTKTKCWFISVCCFCVAQIHCWFLVANNFHLPKTLPPTIGHQRNTINTQSWQMNVRCVDGFYISFQERSKYILYLFWMTVSYVRTCHKE